MALPTDRAMTALSYQACELIEVQFGFQPDNVRNQRENVLMLLGNILSGIPVPDSDRELECAPTQDSLLSWQASHIYLRQGFFCVGQVRHLHTKNGKRPPQRLR